MCGGVGFVPRQMSPITLEIQPLVERRGPQQGAAAAGSRYGGKCGRQRCRGEREVAHGERGDCGDSSMPVIGGDCACVNEAHMSASAGGSQAEGRRTKTNVTRKNVHVWFFLVIYIGETEAFRHAGTLLHVPLAPHHNILYSMCILYVYYLVMHT